MNKKIEAVCQTPLESEESSNLREKAERYLVEVVGCLMDVRLALEGARLGAGVEKGNLIRVGRNFSYQQGILDVCEELSKYASGEVKLQDAINELLEAKRKMVEQQTQEPTTPTGMEVG